eukprot:TRINITY_DN21517_c0_g2_i1.p1 TRINITY_DN21517_c0_g2~~TRINITY_DN21517_c0_g2_i1.p1  ORF type:complete len:125 (-),score=1.12 TRINITY_DN21517_c0_g2_i1:71-445(-)
MEEEWLEDRERGHEVAVGWLPHMLLTKHHQSHQGWGAEKDDGGGGGGVCPPFGASGKGRQTSFPQEPAQKASSVAAGALARNTKGVGGGRGDVMGTVGRHTAARSVLQQQRSGSDDAGSDSNWR